MKQKDRGNTHTHTHTHNGMEIEAVIQKTYLEKENH